MKNDCVFENELVSFDNKIGGNIENINDKR